MFDYADREESRLVIQTQDVRCLSFLINVIRANKYTARAMDVKLVKKIVTH